MLKKTIRRTKKPLSPKPVAKRADTGYSVGQADLDEQQGRRRKAAAEVASILKASALAAAAKEPPTAHSSSKPLAPLAPLWPSSVTPRAEANLPATQKASVTATASPPKTALALPSAKPPPTSPEKSAVVAQAPEPTATKTVNVSFALIEPDAKEVLLCGDFNGWSRIAVPMMLRNEGCWETTIALAPGRYEYKFLVDGQWIPDLFADENVWNQHGTLNSVIEVRA